MSGKVKTKSVIVKQTEIEWEIPNFLISIDDFIVHRSTVFSFCGSSWYLELFRCNVENPDFLSIHLFCSNNRKFPVECDFGVKKQSGTVEHLNRCVMLGDSCRSENGTFIKRSEVCSRRSELVPSDNFTIICRLQCDSYPLLHPIASMKPKLEMLSKLCTLSDNLKNLFSNKESCDTTLNVQDKKYEAHRAILIARSSVFAAMFTHETAEKKEGIVNITDCDPETFGLFLEFLYTGSPQKLSFQHAIHLYETSNKYNVEELKTFCLENIEENLSAENLCEAVIIANKYEEKNLMSAAQEFFNKNLHEILDTSGWDSLVKDNYCLSKELLKGMPSKKRKVAP